MALMQPNKLPSDDRRADQRRPTQDASTLRDPTNAPIDVTVSDLSVSGFRVVCPRDLAIGDVVHLGMPGSGSFAACVLWRDGEHYGCSFTQPLTGAMVAEAFARSSVTPFVLLGPLTIGSTVSPAEQKWPLPVRGWLIVGGAALSWTAIAWAVLA